MDNSQKYSDGRTARREGAVAQHDHQHRAVNHDGQERERKPWGQGGPAAARMLRQSLPVRSAGATAYEHAHATRSSAGGHHDDFPIIAGSQQPINSNHPPPAPPPGSRNVTSPPNGSVSGGPKRAPLYVGQAPASRTTPPQATQSPSLPRQKLHPAFNPISPHTLEPAAPDDWSEPGSYGASAGRGSTGSAGTGSTGRFTAAQSEHTRWLKDAARMSHVIAYKPSSAGQRSDRTPRGGAYARDQQQPETPTHHNAADVLAYDQALVAPGQRQPQSSHRAQPAHHEARGAAGPRRAPHRAERNTDDAGDEGGRQDALDSKVAGMFAQAGNDPLAILGVIQYQMDTGPLSAAALAGALHRLGAAFQNNDGGGRGRGRQGPASKSAVTSHRTFIALKAECVERMGSFTARNLANALWGLARLEHAPNTLLAAACQQVTLRVGQANPQNVSNTLWALGSLSYNPGRACLEALLDRASQLLTDLLPQHISNILLSLAKLGHSPSPAFIMSLGDEACRKLQDFAPQALANSLWAIAKLGCSHTGLMEGVWQTVSDPSTPVWRQLNAQNWGNLAWAYATLGYLPSADMPEQVCAGILPLMDKAAAQNLTNVAWAVAKLRNVPVRAPPLPPTPHTTRQPTHPPHRPAPTNNTPRSHGRTWTSNGGPGTLPGGSGPGNDNNRTNNGVSGGTGVGDGWGANLPRSDDPWVSNVLSVAAGGASVGCSTPTRSELFEMGSSGAISLPVDLLSVADDDYPNMPCSTGSLHSPGTKRPWAATQGRVEQYMNALTRLASRVMPTWQSQAVSNLTWSCAVLDVRPDPAYFTALAARMHNTVQDWPMQHISNTLWAMATMGVKDANLFNTVADHLVARLRLDPNSVDAFKPQHVSNILWAYGTLEVPAPELCAVLFKSLNGRLASFTCQEVSNSCWAVAKLAHYDCHTLDNVADHIATMRLTQLLPQHMSNLAWAYARVTHVHDNMMIGLATAAMQHIKVLTSQHLSNMVCAYAMLGLEHPAVDAFVQACRHEVLLRCNTASNDSSGPNSTHPVRRSSDGSGMRSWGSGEVSNGGELRGVGSGGLGSGEPPFNAQQVTNVIWGMSLLGAGDARLWASLMSVLRNQLSLRAEDLPEEALTQVFQAFLMLQLQGVSASELEHSAPAGVLQYAEECWKKSVESPIVSALHRDVSATLTAMGVRHTNEQLTEDRLFSVDVAISDIPVGMLTGAGATPVSLPGLRALPTDSVKLAVPIALEVDGPSHFAANTLCRPLGVTKLRQRFLAARGWRVTNVSHSAWAAAHGTLGKVALLTQLIMEAVNM